MLACHNLLVLAIFLSYHKGMFIPMLFCSSQSNDTRQLDNTHLIVGCVTSIDLFVFMSTNNKSRKYSFPSKNVTNLGERETKRFFVEKNIGTQIQVERRLEPGWLGA